MSLEWHVRQAIEKTITLPLDCVFYVLGGIETILSEILLSAGRPTPSQCTVCSFLSLFFSAHATLCQNHHV
jgi:hypothetical protein